jgi:hypothetical protein
MEKRGLRLENARNKSRYVWIGHNSLSDFEIALRVKLFKKLPDFFLDDCKVRFSNLPGIDFGEKFVWRQ